MNKKAKRSYFNTSSRFKDNLILKLDPLLTLPPLPPPPKKDSKGDPPPKISPN